MIATIRKALRRRANAWPIPRGLEIVNRRLEASPVEQLMLSLKHFEVDLIVSIDPLPDAHAALRAAALQQPRWQVLERAAVGDREARD